MTQETRVQNGLDVENQTHCESNYDRLANPVTWEASSVRPESKAKQPQMSPRISGVSAPIGGQAREARQSRLSVPRKSVVSFAPLDAEAAPAAEAGTSSSPEAALTAEVGRC